MIGCTWLFLKGVGIWGIYDSRRLGICHHQLRVVDRYRSRRHPDLGDSAAVQADMAQLDQSIRGGDDHLLRWSARAPFPLIHVGRPWLAYWLFPYPNTMNVWPQFRSPLAWDVFAVSTYATISIVFWYVGMIPDFGTLRDTGGVAGGEVFLWSVVSMGWRGSTRHWGALRIRIAAAGGAYRRRWCSRYTRSSASTSRWRPWRVGTPRSSRRTSLPAPSLLRFRHGDLRSRFRSASSITWRI